MVRKDRTYSYCLLTYNQSKTVAAAVKSALDQDCAAMQIVISDDCSKDDTFSIIQQTVAGYAGPHHVVLNRNQRNLGLAGNIDIVHGLSAGDVIIAAAGDDTSHPSRSRQIMRAFETDDCLLACSRAVVVDPQGVELQGDFHKATFYQGWDLAKVAGSNSLYIGATGAWARELYTKYGAFDPAAYEDLVLGFRAALEGRIAVIDEKLVNYCLGGGITSSADYFDDLHAFKAHRAQSYVVASAIMRQRLKDAQTYGLEASSAVWAVIRKAQTRAAIGLSYYRGTRGDLFLHALRHPFLVLDTVYSERRRCRKMLRRMRKRAGGRR
ncbi:glycosyltransferase family 2 protein [Pseudorhodobacter sp.]|uniref:glycosyltransferase family 2 protein n=1 Tax=Pseudorhodobacter sp. TaxID=1934400 RepID=UPI0039E6AB6E